MKILKNSLYYLNMSHNFKKYFGQNFLQDKNIINKIVNYIDLKNEEVIEIGPGQGALTKILVQKAKEVIAYEVDNDLIIYLKKNIMNKNFILKHEDFLKAKLEFENKKTIIANIPYYITSDILFKLFRNNKKIKQALIMVQNEIANKIIALPKQSNYGKLSVSAQFFCDIKKVIFVPKTCFYPQPKVDSAIIYLKFKELNDENIDKEKFLQFLKLSFSQQRKKLINNLKKQYNAKKIEEILNFISLPLLVRPQEINLKTYKIIFKMLN